MILCARDIFVRACSLVVCRICSTRSGDTRAGLLPGHAACERAAFSTRYRYLPLPVARTPVGWIVVHSGMTIFWTIRVCSSPLTGYHLAAL